MARCDRLPPLYTQTRSRFVDSRSLLGYPESRYAVSRFAFSRKGPAYARHVLRSRCVCDGRRKSAEPAARANGPEWSRLTLNVRRKMEPLRAFITSRELETILPGKIAHLREQEAAAELHFSDQVVATLWFRWEGKKSLSQISLWESGDCEVEIADITSGEFLPFRQKRCQTKEEFYSMLDEMIMIVSQNEKSA